MRSFILITTIFFTLFFIPSISLAQILKKESGDLDKANRIVVNKTYTFPSTPVGYGLKQEFPKNVYRSPIVFKEEKNTAWFLLSIPYDGKLTFEISPKNINDDYDWMVFRYNYRLKNDISKDIARPVRSNISRNDKSVASKTGLRNGFQNLFANPGLGKSFSKPLEVKKGDTLAFIIDNIYDDGSGFTFTSKLDLNIPLDGILNGTIFSSKKSPLAGEIICEDDSTGTIIYKGRANSNGFYSIPVPIKRSVNIIASHSGYIFKSADLFTTKPADTVNFHLDPIADGSKLLLFNIHFAPDKDLILFNAAPDLTRLIDFLKECTEYNARIIGHTNNNPFADSKYLQKLSFKRALAVKKQLLSQGISEERISCAGMGGKTPYVNSKDPKEALKNLRVEVVLEKR